MIFAIFQVHEKVLDDLRWNEEADVLEHGNRLEGHADDAPTLDHGAAAVARVDGGIGLYREVAFQA